MRTPLLLPLPLMGWARRAEPPTPRAVLAPEAMAVAVAAVAAAVLATERKDAGSDTR